MQIFSYERPHDDGRNCDILKVAPVNKAARAAMPDGLTFDELPVRWECGRDDFELIALNLPRKIADRALVPLDLVEHSLGREMLPAILSKTKVHRTKTRVSFMLDGYGDAKLVVRYWTSGRVDIFNARIEFEPAVADGLVCIREYQQFEHEPRYLAQAPIAIDASFAELEASFWNIVNPADADPFLRAAGDPYMADDDIVFAAGSEEALRNATELLAYSWVLAQKADDIDSFVVSYRSNCGERAGGFWSEESENTPHGFSPYLWAAFEVIGKQNRFDGSTAAYNDESHCRQSGYYRYPMAIRILIEPASLTAHERIAYLGEKLDAAKAWLRANGFTDENIAEIYG